MDDMIGLGKDVVAGEEDFSSPAGPAKKGRGHKTRGRIKGRCIRPRIRRRCMQLSTSTLAKTDETTPQYHRIFGLTGPLITKFLHACCGSCDVWKESMHFQVGEH